MKVKKMLVTALVAALISMTFSSTVLAAGSIMPSFATLPIGWTTDRYEPASFANFGTFQGHSNVLGIGINSTTGLPARPAPYQYTFYNTQGRGYDFSPVAGPSSVLSADLFIPASWGDSSNGNVRTDMWGTMVDITSDISAYAIIGFTNYGGAPRLRVWDEDTANGWVDLATPVTYGAWTRFAIELQADSSINFYANGTLVYTDYTTNNTAAFKGTIMQAYNFDDPAIPGAILAPYTAHWSNSVPVPTTANQCKNGGWKNVFRADGNGFKNQGDCIQYVNTGK
jgi:hypothetical protein